MSFMAPLSGHLNVALTNFAKQFRQLGLNSDWVAPRVSAARQTDKYYIWDRRDQQLLQKDLRAPGAGAQVVRRTISDGTYHAHSHALASHLVDETKVNLEQVGLGQMVSNAGMATFLQRLILLGKEQRMADLLTTALVTNNVTLAAADQFTDKLNSNPKGVVETAKGVIRLSGVEANRMLVGEDAYQALVAHPQLLAAFSSVERAILTEAHLAAFFQIQEVRIGRAVSVSGADVAGYVVDADDILIFYGSDTPSDEDISFAKTFVWSMAPGTIDGYGVVEGRHPDVTAKTGVVGVDMYYDQKITATETGYLIKDAA